MNTTLTAQEFNALSLTRDLYNQMSVIVGDGPTRTDDLREVATLIHGLQNMVLAQAAARLYPSRFRLLGGEA